MEKDFIDRVWAGSPPVYFINSIEDAAIKSLPGKRFEVKFKDGHTFIQEPGAKLSQLVTDGIFEKREISEKEYQDFQSKK